MREREIDSEITFESIPFKEIRPSLDSAIRNVIKNVYEGNFSGGEITLKIKVSIEDTTTYIDTPGVPDGMPYDFKRPVFDNLVTTTLKKVEKEESSFGSNKVEIRETEDSYALFEIPSNQMKLKI